MTNGSPMYSVDEVFEGQRSAARRDPALLDRILATHEAPNPVSAFCAIAGELGYPIYEMDLISAGEDYYAAMRRSTNGGGENSPLLEGEDDYYEMFLGELRAMKLEQR